MYRGTKVRNLLLLLASVAVMAMVTAPAAAQTFKWQGDDATDPTNWDVAENWADVLDGEGLPGTDGIGDIPPVGARVDIRNAAGKTIDLMGIDRTLGHITLSYMSNAARFQSTGGSATLYFDRFQVTERQSSITFDIDLNGGLFENTRKPGNMTFNGMLTLSDGNSGPSQEAWNVKGGAAYNGGLDVTYQAVSIGGNPIVNANSPATFGAPLVIGDRGTYNANVDGSVSGSTVEIGALGRLNLTVAQTTLPTINVGTFGVLSGDVTGAVYGTNVNLVDNAILAPTGGPEPTEADLGLTPGVKDAMLWKGVTTSSGSYVAGDDGNTVYKGLAVGAFTPTLRLGGGQEFNALAGTDLDMVFVTNATDEQRGADFNSDTGVANLNLYGTSALLLKGNWFEGTATQFHLINVGSVNRQTVYFQNKGPDTGQEIHVYEAQAQLGGTAANGNIKGRLEFHGKTMLWNTGGQIVPVEGTQIVFNDSLGLNISTGKENMFEMLTPGTDLIDNTTEVLVALSSSGGYDFPGTVSGVPNTVMMQLLKKANFCFHTANNWATNSIVVLPADLTVGNGKFVIDESGSHKDIYLGDGVEVGKVVAATDAAQIGFANLSGTGAMRINTTIDGNGTAAIRFGSATAINAIAGTNTRTTAVPASTVSLFDKAAFINTPEISVESGVLRADIDFSFDTDLALNGGTFNVNGKLVTIEAGAALRGDGGTWSNGTITVAGTIAPGSSVGALTGDDLVMLDDAVYALEIADTAGIAGVSHDIVWADNINFDEDGDTVGALTLEITAAGEVDVPVVDTDAFVLFASDSGTITWPTMTITYPLGLEGVVTLEVLDVDGDGDDDSALVLSGMTGTVKPGGGPGMVGDANGDGFVDDNDLSLLLANWGLDVGFEQGEFSGNPPVDDNDLSLLLANWTGSPPSPLAVPEPASLALLSLGALVVLRRRTK